MRALRLPLAITAALAAAGCSTIGGNVKGDFQCSAPGGTCAPTSAIDDQAITSTTSDASVHRVPASDAAGQDSINLYPSTPSVPRALKVVLPPQQDREGRWRNQSVVYVDGAASAIEGGTKPMPVRLSLSELAAGAPELAMFDGPSAPVPLASTDAIRRSVEATLAAQKAARPGTAAAPAAPARTPAIVLPGEGAGLAAAKGEAPRVVTGTSLPQADVGDEH